MRMVPQQALLRGALPVTSVDIAQHGRVRQCRATEVIDKIGQGIALRLRHGHRDKLAHTLASHVRILLKPRFSLLKRASLGGLHPTRNPVAVTNGGIARCVGVERQAQTLELADCSEKVLRR